jgi:hypothetical protein
MYMFGQESQYSARTNSSRYCVSRANAPKFFTVPGWGFKMTDTSTWMLFTGTLVRGTSVELRVDGLGLLSALNEVFL